jgi:hypothetical protein
MNHLSDPQKNIETARAALGALSPPRADDRDDWLAVGMCLHAVSDDLLDQWDNWSKQSEKHRPGESAKQWRSFKRQSSGGRGLGTLVQMADTDSPGWREHPPDRPRSDTWRRNAPATPPPPQKPQRPRQPSQTWPTCREAVAVIDARLGTHTQCWIYLDYVWEPAALVVRWDLPNGEKTIRPFARTKDGRWRIGAMDEPRPIYRLPDIRMLGADVPVAIGEGEKCADSMVSVNMPATTSAGGASAAHKTDWTPLAGRDVAIFPDNDADGRKYARTVAGILQLLDPPARVKIIELPGLAAKGDVADFIAARRTEQGH